MLQTDQLPASIGAAAGSSDRRGIGIIECALVGSNRAVGVGIAGNAPDDELVSRVAGGDRLAFRVLALRHGQRVLGLAHRILGNWAESEDAVQEALLRVWINAGNWQAERGNFKTWFDRIVVNLCIDRSRKPVNAALDDVLERADLKSGPLANAEGMEMAKAIAAAIEMLPDRQKAALALCYYDELTCAEGAQVMEISVSAMEALLVRGRRKVRSHLASLGLMPTEEGS